MMRRNAGNTMIGMMVTLAIMLLLAVGLFYGSGMFQKGGAKSPRADGKGQTIPAQVKLAAQDDVCRSNLNQVRAALQIATMNNDDTPPTELTETRLPQQFYACPIGKEPYAYDASTGRVGCVHPGHNGY
ncbi:MAG: prepilin-type N-terminal cleavage/methylation domain-containing protein [Fimbriimonadaceae bacterium]|nr:prepilin-type N-terminal cleavage/methylation domain-containing protein [Fimbriimonadaceae bacterium]